MQEPGGLYNARLFQAFIGFLRARYPHVDVGAILSRAEISMPELADEAHWFSQRQADLFHDAVVAATNNPNVAREAGRHLASPTALGLLRRYCIGLVGPATLLRVAQHLARSHFTRAVELRPRRLSAHRVEVSVSPVCGVAYKRYQCENTMGALEALAMIFGLRPTLEHPECVFRGDASCRYGLSWSRTPSERLRRIRRILAAFGLVAVVVFSFVSTPRTFEWLAFATIVGTILGGLEIHAGHIAEHELLSLLEESRVAGEKTVEEAYGAYNNALLMHEIGMTLSKQAARLPNASVMEPRSDASTYRSNLDLELDRVMKVLETRLHYDRGIILLADESRTHLTYRASYGATEAEREKWNTFSADLTEDSMNALATCFRERRPTFPTDEVGLAIACETTTDSRWEATQRFVVACPIAYENDALGVFIVDNTRSKKALVQTDLNLVLGIGPAIAIAIHDSILTEARDAAEVKANTDALTRLANRGRGERVLVEEHASAIRNQHPLACLAIDVDHFKRVNDTWGHGMGDIVLEAVAEALRSCVRDADTVVRWGGEEFVIFLPRTPVDGALRVAARILSTLEARRFEELDSLRVTASIGIALGPRTEEPLDLVGTADRALYRAKANGRNRVEVATTGDIHRS